MRRVLVAALLLAAAARLGTAPPTADSGLAFGPVAAGTIHGRVPLWAGRTFRGLPLTRVDAWPGGTSELTYGDWPTLVVSRSRPGVATISGLGGASELVNRPLVRRLGPWWVTGYGSTGDVRELLRTVRPVPRR